ncbi:MAG TPA: polyprenyl synthetase family protein, partial [Pseudomonadales bacterium]
EAMVNYARHMGAAFQITDDVLDYTSSAEAMGKNVGDDLAEGKPTLPLIYAMRHSTPEQAKMIETAIKTGGLDKLDDIIAVVKTSGALDYTVKKAEEESALAIKALEIVPESKYRKALESLAHLAVHRNS